MPIHIGQIIKQEVENKRLTQKEFGDLIHKHHKTVSDIYTREAIGTDLLLKISGVFKKDLFKFYYEEEPLKSLRNDEIKTFVNEINQLKADNEQLKKELKYMQTIIDTQKKLIENCEERDKTREKDQPDNPQK